YLVAYESAGRMADAAKADEWDIAFLAADPSRAQDISFTAPYLEIEATYLVLPASPLTTLDDVDRPGVRIAVSDKRPYALALRRRRASSLVSSTRIMFAASPPPSDACHHPSRLPFSTITRASRCRWPIGRASGRPCPCRRFASRSQPPRCRRPSAISRSSSP